jgi:integrase
MKESKKMPATSESRTWSVYCRGDDAVWTLRFKDPLSGKWRDKRIPAAIGVRTKRQAEEWARAWFREQADRARVTGEFRLGEYLDRWIARRKENPKVRSSTFDNNRGHVRIHIKPALGAHALSELKPKLVRDFVVELRSKPVAARSPNKVPLDRRLLAPHTVRNIMATLRDALDDAVGEELIAGNPLKTPLVAAEIPEAETRAGETVIVHIALQDAERLLSCLDVPEERRARYLLAFTSGMRDGEIAGLTWADVDLVAGNGAVRVSKQIPVKADGKDPKLRACKPKTRYAHRTLPLHPQAMNALREWKATGWVVLVGRQPRPIDPVFPNERGDYHRPRSAELLRQDLELAGCPTLFAGEHPLDFHATRRSFATWLEANGVSGDLIDRMMGHAAKNVRKRHYSATDLELMRRAVETIQLRIEQEAPTVAFAALFAAVPQQEEPESSTIPRSHLGDLNPRPTVYERVGFSRQEARRSTPSDRHRPGAPTFGARFFR